MKLNAFKDLLQSNRGKRFQLALPDRSIVPISFHITEVAHIRKRFIDCGGKLHTIETCQMQAWLGEDTDHRLSAGKIADVLNLAAKILPEGENLDIEIEYEDKVISQYPVANHFVTDEAVILNLATKHTDCLAKELCCPPSLQLLPLTATGATQQTACCGSSCGC